MRLGLSLSLSVLNRACLDICLEDRGIIPHRLDCGRAEQIIREMEGSLLPTITILDLRTHNTDSGVMAFLDVDVRSTDVLLSVAGVEARGRPLYPQPLDWEPRSVHEAVIEHLKSCLLADRTGLLLERGFAIRGPGYATAPDEHVAMDRWRVREAEERMQEDARLDALERDRLDAGFLAAP